METDKGWEGCNKPLFFGPGWVLEKQQTMLNYEQTPRP